MFYNINPSYYDTFKKPKTVTLNEGRSRSSYLTGKKHIYKMQFTNFKQRTHDLFVL